MDLACHANVLQLNIIKQIRMPLTDQIDLMCHDVACCIVNFAEYIAALFLIHCAHIIRYSPHGHLSINDAFLCDLL